MNKIGIDLGGTKIEGIVLNDNLEPIQRKRKTTPQNDYYEILNSIVDLVNDLKTEDSTIGICTPGAISKKSGLIKNSNTKCLIGMPLKEDLGKKLGQEISMENDANCFAMAEVKLGAAQDFDIVFAVIMGTGVGAKCLSSSARTHHLRACPSRTLLGN